MIEQQNIIYYGDSRLLHKDGAITRPVNVVFLTSVRDTGSCDRNGTWVETGKGVRYMEGIIERTVRETHPFWQGPSGMIYEGRLADSVRVVGVITDDLPMDMKNSSYGIYPEPGKDWIHPRSLSTPDGQFVTDMTYNIQSLFRGLPLSSLEGRRRWKSEFEARVLETMGQLGANVLVSDHYMARLDFLPANPTLYGRILNIHPAVTVRDSEYCFRGKTPTADAITRARSGLLTQTGATLHFINESIDDGPPIAYVAGTPVFPDDEPQWLRHRNYQGAKLPLFVAGLNYYVRNIYPNLDQIDPEDKNRWMPLSSKVVLDDRINSNGRIQTHENILLG